MKVVIAIVRIIVGVLFIISGFVKLVDPIGFSIKLSEYFSEEVLNLTFLEPFVLWFALFVVIYEILLGVFLLIGYKPKLTAWGLLLMILFFTFLTFYTAYFNKVTDCGCFGDAVKLSPWETFAKDVALLVMILILFAGIKHIKPIFSKFGLVLTSFFSFIACLWLGYHVLMHLPIIDFRPYKVGANITENMSIPEDAPNPIVEYYWKFNINGKEEIITTNGNYPKVDGDFIGVDTKVIKEGYEPPIHDFSIENEEGDFTEQMLDEENLIIIVAYNLDFAEEDGVVKLKAMSDKAIKNGYKVIGMTATGNEKQQQFKENHKLNFDFYFCDETALKTIVRSNPGILKLSKGTVIQKVHWNDIGDLELQEVERSPKLLKNDENVAIFIDGKLSTHEQINAINEDDIKVMYVYKDQEPVKEFNKKNNTSFDNIIKVGLKNSKNDVAYFVNGEPSTKKAVEALNTDKIESVNVIKDSIQLKEFNAENHTFYTGKVEVKLKDE
ncbi:BT_3928 family protein [Algibacter sp. R77976]|uniref:BT_3928 family protein n=1 Tax=Algibacter sp. R77976 TaxID=3093873 RepID=UPI0037CBD59D